MQYSSLLETCRCPSRVSTNYYLLPPYIYMRGKDLHGVFSRILKEMIHQTCGHCNRGVGEKESTVDVHRNGRSSYSLKANELRVTLNVDEHTDLSFPIVGTRDQRTFLGYPFVSVVDHPGVVLLVKDRTFDEVVADKVILMMLTCWPLLALMLLMSVVASVLVWLLVSL